MTFWVAHITECTLCRLKKNKFHSLVISIYEHALYHRDWYETRSTLKTHFFIQMECH
jgi:hypothetical protein